MNTSLFPDVNVWLALAHPIHPHHASAVSWSGEVGVSRPILFCRFTQLGLLRLLTTRKVMGPEAMTQAASWKVFDTFLSNPTIRLVEEPADLDLFFRHRTTRDEISPKLWADGYLAAFAEAGGYSFVSFDKALAKRVSGSVLLRPATA